jgi:hypothetical protein
MLRRCALFLVLTGTIVVAGCGIHWERTGQVPDAVTEHLLHEHGVKHADVQCIRRELTGAVWECKAESATASFECEVKTSIHHEITFLECEEHGGHEEPGAPEKHEAPEKHDAPEEHAAAEEHALS